MNGNYILKHRKPIPIDNLLKWASWFENSYRLRKVRKSYIGDYCISTVFLAINHNYGFYGPPELFETMIFNINDLGNDLYMTRCSTWRQALHMHRIAKTAVKNGEFIND